MEPLARFSPATLAVLETLLQADEELYAYRIAKNSRRKTGTIVPILDRLENADWVESRWEADEPDCRRPRRRFYHLTPDGRAAASTVLAGRYRTPRLHSASWTPRRNGKPVTAFSGLQGGS
jgi:PadR family transcriptional regulator PadR